jgi:hypothetical protein
MRFAPTALLLLVLLPPSAARAVEAVFGADAQTSYDSNVFFVTDPVEQGGSVRFGPMLGIQDRTGALTYRLNYRPSYEVFYNLSGINSLYQLADGSVSWRPSYATELFATDSVSDTPVRSTTFATNQQTLLAQPTFLFTNDDVLQNYFNAGIRHNFTPRIQAELSASNVLVNYQNPTFADSMSTTGQGFGSYVLDRANVVGAGLGYTRQTFTRSGGSSGGTSYYQLFLIWNHEFSPTWSLKANAGPTLVSPDSTSFPSSQTFPEFSLPVTRGNQTVLFPTDPTTCPTVSGLLAISGCRGTYQALTAAQLGLDGRRSIPRLGAEPDTASSSVTYFADLSLVKRWRWFTASLGYVRNASSTSGFNQSILTDSVTATGFWDPSPLWRFTLTGVYIERSTNSGSAQTVVVGRSVPNLVPVPIRTQFGTLFVLNPGAQATAFVALKQTGTRDISTYGTTAQVNRNLSAHSYVFGRFTYTRQTSTSSFSNVFSGLSTTFNSSLDRFLFTVGFHYEFDAIHLD